jgi:hypothetical protein
MNTSIQFGPADRDDRGFVKAPTPPQEPRSLADLLPTSQSIQADAQRPAPPRAMSKTEQALLAIVLLLAIGFFAWRIRSSGDVAPPSEADRPAATQTSGGSATQPSPIPAMLPAYSAPDVPLGPIEATRAMTPTAHYGQDWIQAMVQGSGRIWLRASDWPSLAIVGPDLAPPPARAAAPAPAAAPAVFVPEATTPPPPPPPCAQAGVPGKMVEVCGDGDLDALAKEKWIATYGGNVGVVSTPSPQIKRTP